MKAVIYIRISTDKQNIKEQIEICKQKADALGIVEKLTFIDKDTFDYTPLLKRKEMPKAFKELCVGDKFIVKDFDRISRNLSLVVECYGIVNRKSALLIAALDNKNHKKEKVYSRSDIAHSNLKTQQVLNNKKSQNKLAGNIAYGFEISNNKVKKSKKEQEVISFIKKLRSSGLAFEKIVPQLFLSGYRNRKGNQISSTQVHRILKANAIETKAKKKNLPYGFAYFDNKIEQCPQEQHIINLAKQLRDQGMIYREITNHINDLGYRNRAGNVFILSAIYKIISKANNVAKRKKNKAKIKSLQVNSIGKQSDVKGVETLFKPATKSKSNLNNLETIELVNELRSKGYSLNAIAFELYEQDIVNKNGNQYNSSAISNVLNSSTNIKLIKTAGAANLTYGFKYKPNSFEQEHCEYEQKIISLIHILCAQGLGVSKITKEINNQGYKNRAGNIFKPQQIDRILKRNYNDEECHLQKDRYENINTIS